MNTPVSTPAGAQPTTPENNEAKPPAKPVSERDRREADDAYLSGARAVEHHNYVAAEKSFAHAVSLNPNNADYTRAVLFAREARVTELIHEAALARYKKDNTRAQSLLAEAHKLDPDNRIAAAHLAAGGEPNSPAIDPLRFPAENIASTLAGAPHLKATPGKHSFNERGDAASVLRAVYGAWGIQIAMDESAPQTQNVRFVLDDADFDTATALVHQMTKSFAAPVQADRVIISKDTQENRDRLMPLIEETIYLRGMSNEQMQEFANVARNVFDIKNVTASATGGTILLRGDEPTLRLVNATYADMLDGDSDVLLDINLYEIDKSVTRDIGVTTPTSASVFPVYTTATNILNENQSSISQAVSAGLLTLTGNAATDLPVELYFLYAAGLLTSSESSLISGLLGTLGTYNGLPLAGVTISSGVTLNALLTDSEAHLLDSMQVRAGNNQPAEFRTGEHYPIVTATYTSGSASTSAAVSSLLAQYGYSSTSTAASVPQIQYEDLGLTLKATPRIQRSGQVFLKMDLKLEALGSTSLNGIPVLNNRQFTSTTTVPDGQTVLLTSQVSSSEIGALSGLPGLNDVPGFQGTNKDVENDKTELLITITPHVVRQANAHVTSRALRAPHPLAESQ